MMSLLAMPPGDMSCDLLLVVGPGLASVEIAVIICLVGPRLTGDSVAKEAEVVANSFLDF